MNNDVELDYQEEDDNEYNFCPLCGDMYAVNCATCGYCEEEER